MVAQFDGSYSVDWMIRNDSELSNLPEENRVFVLAYEYILSSQWGKGKPWTVEEELFGKKVKKVK